MDISKLNVYSVCQMQTEEFLREFELTGIPAWTLPKVMTAIMAARIGRSSGARYGLIAAKALETLEPSEQAAVRNEVNLPTDVLNANTQLVWPSALPADTPSLDLEEFRTLQMNLIAREIDRVGLEITGTFYPDVERLSWGQKSTMAVKYLEDPQTLSAAETLMLQAESDLTGETMTSLAQTINTRATEFMQAMGRLSGIRRVAQNSIAAAQNTLEVNQVVQDTRNALDNVLSPSI